jgi:hypothetical protein
MNPMGHDTPLMIGVNQSGVEETVRDLLPGYMAMGEHGMDEMAEMHMDGPANTLPMMSSDDGPFGSIGMGGMFTILKVRKKQAELDAGGWYPHPEGTVAGSIGPAKTPSPTPRAFTCPMHPEVRQNGPGECPKCGMDLVPEEEPGEKGTETPGPPGHDDH